MKFKIFMLALIFLPFLLYPMHQEKEELNGVLFQAVSKGKLEIVHILSRNPCVTPLLLDIAVQKGHIKTVKLFLENGANPNGGAGPLILAVKYDFPKIVKLLLGYSAIINILDVDGGTPLAIAAKTDNSTIVRILLKHYADTKTVDDDDDVTISLECAATFKRFKIVKLLLQHINHILDKIDEPEKLHLWDLGILNALNKIEKGWRWTYPIETINAFHMLLHHADKLPLSRKKLESLTAQTLGVRYGGEYAFRETVEHLRKNAF